MKRQREDPLSYLGGDLADIQVDEDRHLTKAQKNQLRKANNKKWKLTDRKVGSGRDPCPRHTLYYKAQIPELRDEEEWTAFQTALVDPLPVSFRIGGGCPAVVEVSKQPATVFPANYVSQFSNKVFTTFVFVDIFDLLLVSGYISKEDGQRIQQIFRSLRGSGRASAHTEHCQARALGGSRGVAGERRQRHVSQEPWF